VVAVVVMMVEDDVIMIDRKGIRRRKDKILRSSKGFCAKEIFIDQH
jgi:hypothetical protein